MKKYLLLTALACTAFCTQAHADNGTIYCLPNSQACYNAQGQPVSVLNLPPAVAQRFQGAQNVQAPQTTAPQIATMQGAPQSLPQASAKPQSNYVAGREPVNLVNTQPQPATAPIQSVATEVAPVQAVSVQTAAPAAEAPAQTSAVTNADIKWFKPNSPAVQSEPVAASFAIIEPAAGDVPADAVVISDGQKATTIKPEASYQPPARPRMMDQQQPAFKPAPAQQQAQPQTTAAVAPATTSETAPKTVAATSIDCTPPQPPPGYRYEPLGPVKNGFCPAFGLAPTNKNAQTVTADATPASSCPRLVPPRGYVFQERENGCPVLVRTGAWIKKGK